MVQLMQRNEDDARKYWNALEVLFAAEKEARELIDDVKAAIAEHQEKSEALKAETAKLRASRKTANSTDQQETEISRLDKGKGKERYSSETPSVSDSEDDDDLPRNPLGEEYRIKKTALQHRLRECHIAFHKVLFLKGDIYHVLGQAHEAQENEAYTAAEELRRTLLKSKSSPIWSIVS